MLFFYLSLIESEEDQTLFARIYETYRQRMFHYAMQLLRDEGDAEDAVQEVFLFIAKSGVEKIRNVEQTGNLWAYLSAAVRNQSYHLRKDRNGFPIVDADLNDLIGSKQAKDEDGTDTAYHELVKTIRGMPPTYADVLYYTLVQEMPSEKIAKLLHLAPATVRKRISRGKEMLREKLGKDYFA